MAGCGTHSHQGHGALGFLGEGSLTRRQRNPCRLAASVIARGAKFAVRLSSIVATMAADGSRLEPVTSRPKVGSSRGLFACLAPRAKDEGLEARQKRKAGGLGDEAPELLAYLGTTQPVHTSASLPGSSTASCSTADTAASLRAVDIEVAEQGDGGTPESSGSPSVVSPEPVDDDLAGPLQRSLRSASSSATAQQTGEARARIWDLGPTSSREQGSPGTMPVAVPGKAYAPPPSPVTATATGGTELSSPSLAHLLLHRMPSDGGSTSTSASLSFGSISSTASTSRVWCGSDHASLGSGSQLPHRMLRRNTVAILIPAHAGDGAAVGTGAAGEGAGGSGGAGAPGATRAVQRRVTDLLCHHHTSLHKLRSQAGDVHGEAALQRLWR